MSKMCRMTCLVLLCATLAACGAQPVVQATLSAVQQHEASAALYVGGHDLYEGSGRRVALHGLNWFGFNSGTTMVDGLWGGPGIISDFATVVQRQKLLGFNAVRLPFSFHDLHGLAPKNFAQTCTMPTDADVARSVLAPGKVLPGKIAPLPFPTHRVAGQCNGYLPNDTVYNRFRWVVSFYARNGFYVLIDNHLREDRTALDSATNWASQWAQLVKDLRQDPAVKSKLMVDLLNEPDNFGIRWEAQAGTPGLGDLYLQAMDAIEAASPGTVYFIEGTGQGALNTNWGDGFCTDNDLIAQHKLSNPRPFFAALMRKPYGRHVVLAPHVYGPAVTTNDQDSAGEGLVTRLTQSFGGMTQHGFCADSATGQSSCQSFPVAIGEFGSKMQDPRDLATLDTFVSYLRAENQGDDGLHAPINNFFWWSWNPNSGDTGGLVGDDWLAVQWNKMAILNKLGLRAAPGF
jgi:aryl-phospho-beta-D-glucosidase BglC (GH1 family)